MSDSVWPHRWQPTRLPHPWDSPGKNTGVGCHFLLQCRKVKSESEVAQSCLTFSNPTDCSLPGSSIHGIFQARVLESGAIAFSKLEFSPKQYICILSIIFCSLFSRNENHFQKNLTKGWYESISWALQHQSKSTWDWFSQQQVRRVLLC